MYKNMYNPKSKISLLFLCFIATILAKSQGENKQKQEDNKSEMEWRQDKRKEWSNLNSFQNYPFWAYIKEIITFIFWCMVIPLGPQLIYT